MEPLWAALACSQVAGAHSVPECGWPSSGTGTVCESGDMCLSRQEEVEEAEFGKVEPLHPRR